MDNYSRLNPHQRTSPDNGDAMPYRSLSARQGSIRPVNPMRAPMVRPEESVYRSIGGCMTAQPSLVGSYMPHVMNKSGSVQVNNGRKTHGFAKPQLVGHPREGLFSTPVTPVAPSTAPAQYVAGFAPVNLADYDLPPKSSAFVQNGIAQLGVLVKQVSSACRGAGIDFEVRPQNCKFKCVTYVRGAPVKFDIKFFQLTPAEQQEFDHRGNLVLSFEKMVSVLPFDWRMVVNSVLCRVVAENPSVNVDFDCSVDNLRASKSAAKMDPPIMKRQLSAVAEQENGLKHLLELAQSPYADVKEQALQILSKLSEDVSTAELLNRLQAVETLCTLCAEKDTDWAKATVTTIANICSRPEFCSEKQLVPVLDVIAQLFLALKDATSYLKFELKREAARALAELSKNRGAAQTIASSTHRDLVDAMKQCCDNRTADPRLALHAASALRNIQDV